MTSLLSYVEFKKFAENKGYNLLKPQLRLAEAWIRGENFKTAKAFGRTFLIKVYAEYLEWKNE